MLLDGLGMGPLRLSTRKPKFRGYLEYRTSPEYATEWGEDSSPCSVAYSGFVGTHGVSVDLMIPSLGNRWFWSTVFPALYRSCV